ncbi:hypothetical protein OG871_40295 (plasmid) [Kitasatospora sp. NBC_00374]|uniref:hypothetical protein n=1 Tax=Kitasatospora sp. NBC_00374 TaxID=2975964 RepID=UPI002F919C95
MTTLPNAAPALATAAYLSAGLGALSTTGITQAWFRNGRDAEGRSAVTAAWLFLLALWPVPLVLRAVRELRAPRPRGAHRAGPKNTPPAPKTSAPPRPTYPPVPPDWFRCKYDGARTALTEGRTDIARRRVTGLIDDATKYFGADHPYARYAWDLLAEILLSAPANPDQASVYVPSPAGFAAAVN